MGGMTMNMRQDMVAAAVVAESGVQLTCVSSELTRGQMDFGPRRPLFSVLRRLLELDASYKGAGEVTRMLANLTTCWMNQAGWIGLADPLTVAVALDPEQWGTYCRGRFGVHLGALGVDFAPDDSGPHRALEADKFEATGRAQRFVEVFERAFNDYWSI